MARRAHRAAGREVLDQSVGSDGGGTAVTKQRKRPESQRDTRRRFEQWAANPHCGANTLSAVHNIKMDNVAAHAGFKPSFGASPFALFRGDQFERNLLRDGAERLYLELQRTEVLPDTSAGLLDLRISMNGGTDPSLMTLDDACDKTLEALRTIGRASGDDLSGLPGVIAAATVKLPEGTMLPEALLILDLLVVRPGAEGRAEVLVGEIKTYPDRGGHTDPKQLAQARAQLGLYLHAVRCVTADWPEDERPNLRDEGFLVLSRPGSDFARVRAHEQLRYQAARAERGFAMLESTSHALPPNWDDDTSDEERLAAVLHAETHYSEACLSFCDLAGRCHGAAVEAGSASVLGDAVASFVGNVSLHRISELFDGAPPMDDTERDLMDRVRAAEDPGW